MATPRKVLYNQKVNLGGRHMKNVNVIDIKPNTNITDFFMIKATSIKVGSNGKEYQDVMLTDATGDLSAKKWDVDENNIEFLKSLKVGDLVKVRGSVTDWKGQTQLRINQIRLATEEDDLEMSDFVKSAPEKPIDMYEYIIGEINAMQDEDFKKLCLHLYEGNKEKLMYYPAAMSNHHAEYGGLLYHIKRMMMSANKLCEVYTNLSRDLLVAGVAIHDIEKLNEILSDKNGISPGYSFKGQMLGHIVQGITLVNDLCKELGISEEKAVLLEHMILSHHYEPEFGSPKKPLFPEAEMLHYLDIVDARMFDMEEGLKGVSDGEFGDRVWPLDNRRLYKRTF